MTRNRLLSLYLLLLFSCSAAPLLAQVADTGVAEDLSRLHDESLPPLKRGLVISRLLTGGEPAALAGLREIIASEARPLDLRLAVVEGALDDPRLALLDDILVAIEAGGELAPGARARFYRAGRHVIRSLAARASDEAREAEDRTLAVELLGKTGEHAAVEPVLDLWAEGKPPVDVAAREAWVELTTQTFDSAADAKEWWSENSHKDLPTILRELRKEQANGDSGNREIVDFARRVIGHATIDDLVTLYLPHVVKDVRTMGAARLGTYPYEERLGEGAEDARRKAGGAILDALDKETEDLALVAELGALRALLKSAKDEDLDRAITVVEIRLDSVSRDVKMAAVSALGDFGRRPKRALRTLRQRYDSLAGHDPECRLAILDSIERIGQGITGWVRDKLKAGESDERITVRLIRLLKKNGNDSASSESIPTLIKFLGASSAQVRQEAASTLGLLGVRNGDAAAIAALADQGLEDEDTSVRVISAKQLGGAPWVDEHVIERLRARLRENEPEESVRVEAAQSLLKLRGAGALEYLSDYLADDGLWDAAVLSFITADLVAGGQADAAAGFVSKLCGLGHYERSAAAARLLLAADGLDWVKAPAARGEVSFCLARSLDAIDQPGEALQALTEVPETLPSDPRGVERALLHARILRRSGAPEKVAGALSKILEMEDPPADAVPRANLELARAHLELEKWDEAMQVVKPLLADPVYGAQASEIERKALAGRGNGEKTEEDLVRDLDSPDPETRKRAIAALKASGKAVYGRLAEWLRAKKSDEVIDAVKSIEGITGLTVPYDPLDPEKTRAWVLAELRKGAER
jgi:HEAT repeat protein